MKTPSAYDFTGKFSWKHEKSDNPNGIYVALVLRERSKTPKSFCKASIALICTHVNIRQKKNCRPTLRSNFNAKILNKIFAHRIQNIKEIIHEIKWDLL